VKSIVLWFLGVAFASIVSAQGDAAISTPILMNVMSGDVALTPKMHQDFWRELRKGPPMSDAELRTMVTGALELNLAFQEAVWASARESYLAEQVVKTSALESAEATHLERVGALIPAPAGSRKQREALAELARRFQSMQRDEQILLSAAAFRGPFVLSSGYKGTMSEPSIQDAMSGLRATKRRVEQLMNPVWREANP